MAYQKCLDAIREAGGDLSDDEISELVEELQRLQRYYEATGKAADSEDAAMKAAEALGEKMKLAAVIEKRNAALNLKRQIEAVGFVKSQFAKDPGTGVEALLVGVNNLRQGSRLSVMAAQRERTGFYLGGFAADLERLGLSDVLAKGDLDLDVARALWAKDNPSAPPFKGPAEAQQIADVVHKWQEVTRLDQNKAGAWIGKMQGYITRQSHDAHALIKAGFDKWKQAIGTKLDWDRILADMPDKDPEEFLKAAYNGIVSGQHFKTGTAEPSGFKGPSNLAKKLSQERVLHFKTADDWFNYNAEFGTGNLRESVVRGFSSAAENVGMLRTMGTNPGAMIEKITSEVSRSLKDDPIALKNFMQRKPDFDRYLKSVDGTMRIPVNGMMARVSSNVRAGQGMAKLGAALAAQFSDIGLFGSEMRYQGATYLSGMGEAIGGLLRGRGSTEQRKVLSELGVFFESAIGEITNRFSAADSLGGKMSKLQQAFFKINGMSWWTDTMRASAGLMMSHRLANMKDLSWGEIGDLQRSLSLFGIDEGKWDLVRQGAVKEADGKAYLTPEAVRDVPDEALAGYLESRGQKSTPRNVASLREEIESSLRTYFVDRVDFAALTPDAKTQAYMLRGTQPGTIEGETLRFVAQFKSFNAAMIQKPIGREIYGYGSDTLAEAMKDGRGTMLGLAQLMVWTTLFGYGSMVAKDALKNKTPRDPANYKTWIAAMSQGGGLGIYGDFLFGQSNRLGGGLVSTLAGPTLGTAGDVADIWTTLRDGDPGGAGAKAFRTALNNTPYMNLFYVRPVMDYLFLNQLQESMNPGYIQRTRQRMEKEGQQFILPPS